MDGHTRGLGPRTEPRLQANSPSPHLSQPESLLLRRSGGWLAAFVTIAKAALAAAEALIESGVVTRFEQA